MGTKTNYLLLYNTACFILWTYLTLKTLATLPASLTDLPTRRLLSHTLLSPALAGTQSLAGLEVLHAAAGLVRASPLTTAIQVGGKNLVVWTVMLAFPDLLEGEAGSWGFLGCLLAWGCSEMIRYGFFVVQLSSADGRTPRWLRWL
ncbi:tyrosine phosphatase-like protein, partial [Xylariomycetidae sp. FL2044]